MHSEQDAGLLKMMFMITQDLLEASVHRVWSPWEGELIEKERGREKFGIFHGTSYRAVQFESLNCTSSGYYPQYGSEHVPAELGGYSYGDKSNIRPERERELVASNTCMLQLCMHTNPQQ